MPDPYNAGGDFFVSTFRNAILLIGRFTPSQSNILYGIVCRPDINPGQETILGGFMKNHSVTATHARIRFLAATATLLAFPLCTHAAFTGSGSLALSSGTRTVSDSTITASSLNQSAVYVTGGILTLKNDKVSSTGYVSASTSTSLPGAGGGGPSASGTDSASFYGLAAGILAWSESGSAIIDVTNTHVTTTGTGANGVFAYSKGVISITGDSVICTGNYAHAIMCSGGGKLTAKNLYLSTAGTNSGAVATDRNGGTITLDSSTVITSGADSPGIYSTGTITVSNSSVSSATEAASIEGTNSIILRNTKLSGSAGKKSRGIFIYQSMSGDATGSHSTFNMTGGSYTWPSSSGPAFFVTNDTGVITLTGVTVSNSSPLLALASSVAYATKESWGTTGSNGGKMRFTADSSTALAGNLVIDSISDLFLTLKHGSSLTGNIDSANSGKLVTVTLDSTSTWTVTKTSYLDTITDPLINTNDYTVTNIVGNGHNVVYAKAANSKLGGKVYALAGSGCLVPSDSVSATCSNNPSAGIAAQATLAPNSSIHLSGWGRISLGSAYAGKVKTLALYDLQGKCLGIRTTTSDDISVQELFGASQNALHVLKILSAH